ncbi:hypothetical protein HZQ23_10160 [Elizabethkingia anophelis]|uniref:hypothetical protein n=1 Tax=Elizabethkingia anophelis TaxID=1117645 RepID=UPI0020B40232|nr:hypothetical protein [Elizabethkingia anophelis]MCT3991301.1 hypothetical protein [Elizabethkingia anophelis]MCT4009269.1 hypothetical protein [Elizabethkingia anophelis]MDV4141870.1 hypothetical protein [Elizabethkingia anophelis]UTF95467.1 hypothetical protein J2N94_11795 [Elizabethkingia anophelis]
MDFFSIIGTIASIGSIPLSIYLFIKSKENNIDKVKRDIVRILSHQIGDRRQLTTFEIQTVINSKTRETKIDNEKITVNHIIEDLVSETISNPLLEKSIKENIIIELKKIYFKGELLTSIDNIELETRTESEKKTNDVNIEKEIKSIIEKRGEINKVIEDKYKRVRTSETYAIIAGTMTILASGLIFAGKEKYDDISKPLYDFIQKNDFYIGIIISIITAILASTILMIFKTLKKK